MDLTLDVTQISNRTVRLLDSGGCKCNAGLDLLTCVYILSVCICIMHFHIPRTTATSGSRFAPPTTRSRCSRYSSMHRPQRCCSDSGMWCHRLTTWCLGAAQHPSVCSVFVCIGERYESADTYPKNCAATEYQHAHACS